MRRALVLSGGGSRGAFEVGVVEYLVNEVGLDFQIFLGTSVGALNASLLGQARNRAELMMEVHKLKQLWLNIKGNSSIYSCNPWGIFRLLFKVAMHEPVGLKKLIKQYVDINRLFDPATVVKVATVALETGELLIADTRDRSFRKDYLSYILASASVPLFFPPVPIQGKHWYDGGLRDITPLGSAFEERPDEIVVILTYPINPDLSPVIRHDRPGGALKAIWRVIEILTNEVGANDLQVAELINRNYLAIPGKRHVPIRIIHPELPLIGDTMVFDPKSIREQMRQGFAAARKYWTQRGKCQQVAVVH